jgi:hypothetical protein
MTVFFTSNKSLGAPFKPCFGLSGVVADPKPGYEIPNESFSRRFAPTK